MYGLQHGSVDQWGAPFGGCVRARQPVAITGWYRGTVATHGGSEVSRVVRTMQEINDNSKKTSEVIDVIGLIDDIAFKTNILALNAAVEATRDGE